MSDWATEMDKAGIGDQPTPRTEAGRAWHATAHRSSAPDPCPVLDIILAIEAQAHTEALDPYTNLAEHGRQSDAGTHAFDPACRFCLRLYWEEAQARTGALDERETLLAWRGRLIAEGVDPRLLLMPGEEPTPRTEADTGRIVTRQNVRWLALLLSPSHDLAAQAKARDLADDWYDAVGPPIAAQARTDGKTLGHAMRNVARRNNRHIDWSKDGEAVALEYDQLTKMPG
jgi:hypothetical protein